MLALIGGLVSCAPRHRAEWDARAAAAYLDRREAWWAGWPPAAEAAGGPAERGLLDDVSRRARLWRTIRPYYPNEALSSRGTEAVLNAVVLASRAARLGHLDADAEAAFDDMWALQDTSGASAGSWPWIHFNNEPWEAPDSRYYGAVLAAIAVGLAPRDYRSRPAIQDALTRLRSYLEREYPAQTPINRVALLWASARWPELMSSERRESLIAEVGDLQRPDGGWSLASLVGPWKRRDGTRNRSN